MLTATNVSKGYGGQLLYKDASFIISPGEKVGLVGPNGAGKTSLFRLITGEEKPDAGTIGVPDKIRLAYFSQSVGEMKGKTVLEEVIHANPRIDQLKKDLTHLEEKLGTELSDDEMQKTLEKLGDVQTEFEQLGGYDLEHQAQAILTGLGLMPHQHQQKVEEFSGGWKMRIALAKVLVQRPDIILMDEPTNYLDMESILWLEEWLKNFPGAVFMTCHDREFMNSIVKKIVEVNHQALTVFSGNYDFYEKEKKIRLEQLRASHSRQQDMLAKEEEFIARFAARASHAAQVQSRVKKLDKIDRIELPPEDQIINFEFPKAPRSGNDVVKMKEVFKTYETPIGPKTVFSHVNGVVERLDRLAVVGVNGAGKSTLLKCIAKQINPTEGSLELGSNVELGYFSQFSLDILKPNLTVMEEMRSRLQDKNDGYIRNLLAAFLFRGDDVDKKISVLSGGEKSRLILASLLTSPVNLLILDEPTNHLDIRSREVLVDALKNFEGTLIIVSHDRHFLKQLCNKVAEVSKGGVSFYPGNYDEYTEWKSRQLQ
jgi:ATP-binding cassette subfamily F protein 3